MLVLYCLFRYYRVKHNAEINAPDFSVSSSVADFLSYIPAPTATLLAFFIFGTTAQLRARYASILGHVFCLGRKMPLSPMIDRSSAQQWSRMTSQELRENRRYKLRNGQLESIELGEKKDPSEGVHVVISADAESESTNDRLPQYHQPTIREA